MGMLYNHQNIWESLRKNMKTKPKGAGDMPQQSLGCSPGELCSSPSTYLTAHSQL